MAVDSTISLCTLAEAKSFLQGSTTGSTTYDPRYELIIDSVSKRFNGEVGYCLKKNDYVEDHDGNGTREMYLDRWPVSTSGVIVAIDDTYTFTTAYYVTSTDVRPYYAEGKLYLYGDAFSEGRLNIRVTYAAGYSTSEIPADLKRAALETVQLFWNREEKRDRIGIRSESMEGGSRTFETDLPWSAKQVLDNYRCKRFY